MNCAILQRRLLGCEQPDQPPAELQQHLDACPGCRAWQRHLLQVEREIPLLPVPTVPVPDRLLQMFETGLGTAEPVVRLPSWGWRPSPRERALRKIALAFSMAAALLVFALGWWAWLTPSPPGTGRPPADALAARKVLRDQRLAAARSPGERVRALADLADDLRQEARALVQGARPDLDALSQVAEFYAQVIDEDLVAQAGTLPDDPERAEVLAGVADRLIRTESEMQRLLTDSVQTAAAPPLRDIARAARRGHDHLRALLALAG